MTVDALIEFLEMCNGNDIVVIEHEMGYATPRPEARVANKWDYYVDTEESLRIPAGQHFVVLQEFEMTFAIDWDGTMWDRQTKGFYPGAIDAIQKLRGRGHVVIIHSSNRPSWIQQELNEAGLAVDSIWQGAGKPIADHYIDDRAIQHEAWPATMRLLQGVI